MRKLFQGKAFDFGFVAGIILFVFANMFTIPDSGNGICFDCYEAVGFPFTFHEKGTILHLNQFVWAGVIADISIAIIFSVVLGLMFNYVWSKISMNRYY